MHREVWLSRKASETFRLFLTPSNKHQSNYSIRRKLQISRTTNKPSAVHTLPWRLIFNRLLE